MSEAIRTMFDAISGRYDTLNRVLSAGRDRGWRKRASHLLVGENPQTRVLDLCGGTGDFARALREAGITCPVLIGDFSQPMLRLSKHKAGLSAACAVLDALQPPFRPNSFSAVVCGFGMRNLDGLEKGIHTVYDLLKPGGVFITLEFFRPQTWITHFFYRVLAPAFIPLGGRLLGSRREAYAYLVRSVLGFRSPGEYADLCRQAGFKRVEVAAYDWGIAHAVRAIKGEKT